MSYYCLRGRRGHDRMVVEFIAKNGPIQSVHITTNSKKNYVIFRHSRPFICKQLYLRNCRVNMVQTEVNNN
jgi:hypothetical protein